MGNNKRMNKIKRKHGYLVLAKGHNKAVSDEENVEMLVQQFVKGHSSRNVSEEKRREREATRVEN